MLSDSTKKRLVDELAWFAIPLFLGVIVLPACVYAVGGIVFGDYEGGYLNFFGSWVRRVLEGSAGGIFVVLSPWLAVVVVRLMRAGLAKTLPNQSKSAET